MIGERVPPGKIAGTAMPKGPGRCSTLNLSALSATKGAASYARATQRQALQKSHSRKNAGMSHRTGCRVGIPNSLYPF